MAAITVDLEIDIANILPSIGLPSFEFSFPPEAVADAIADIDAAVIDAIATVNDFIESTLGQIEDIVNELLASIPSLSINLKIVFGQVTIANITVTSSIVCLQLPKLIIPTPQLNVPGFTITTPEISLATLFPGIQASVQIPLPACPIPPIVIPT